jgi:hypothetical protein
VQTEYGGYCSSKAKYSLAIPIAYKYREGKVQSTPSGERKGLETTGKEPVVRCRK